MRDFNPSVARAAAIATACVALLTAGCATVDTPVAGAAADAAASKSVIRGSVVYRDKVTLPADAEMTMRLVDVTHPAKPVVVAEETSKLAGKQVPIAFAMPFDPGKVTGKANVLQAAIRYEGKVQFVTATHVYIAPNALPEALVIAVIKGDRQLGAADYESPMPNRFVPPKARPGRQR